MPDRWKQSLAHHYQELRSRIHRSRWFVGTPLALQAGDRLVRSGIELLFPPLCACCGTDLPEQSPPPWLCVPCSELLAPPPRPACPQCGIGLESSGRLTTCSTCANRPFRFDRLIALGDYQQDLRSAVLRSKRRGDEVLARALAGLLWQSRQPDLQTLDVHAIVPVPMHWFRRMARRYNGPDILADELGRKLGVPVRQLIRRRRYTRSQGTLPATRRISNVAGAFDIRRSTELAGKRLLLVDDVVTSGATCNEAARLLKRHGATFVAVATICRTQPPS